MSTWGASPLGLFAHNEIYVPIWESAAMTEFALLSSETLLGVLVGLLLGAILQEIRAAFAFRRERRRLLWERQVERFDLLVEKTAQLAVEAETLGSFLKNLQNHSNRLGYLSRRRERLMCIARKLGNDTYLRESNERGRVGRNERLVAGIDTRLKLASTELDAYASTTPTLLNDVKARTNRLMELAIEIDVMRRIVLRNVPHLDELFRRTFADVSVAGLASSLAADSELAKARESLRRLFDELLVYRDELPKLPNRRWDAIAFWRRKR